MFDSDSVDVTSPSPVPELTLNNGNVIPQLGLGVFQIAPTDTAEAVSQALDIGFRHFDTAQGYGNEKEVGDAIARSGIDPGNVFLTTKLSNEYITYASARRSIDRSLEAFGAKVPDLFLVHWPLAMVRDFMLVWRALEDAYVDQGLGAIGVSNFQVEHLTRLLGEANVAPAANQIELHPYFAQRTLRAFHAKQGIVTQAWAPLGQGLLLADPTIQQIATEVERTPAQVVIRWHLQSGIVVFPKSTSPARMRENFGVFDFVLSDSQMSRIDALDRGQRLGKHPDEFRGGH